jgi:hypothetical protein
LTKARDPDEGVFTTEDLLKVASVSDGMKAVLQTNKQKISVFLEVVEKILKDNGDFYEKLSDNDQSQLINLFKERKDTTTLPLFQTLLGKMEDRPSLIQSIKESLEYASKSLVANSKRDRGKGYLKSNKDYNTFIEGLREVKTTEINFSKRCGIGDVLAEDTQPIKCVTFLKATKAPYNYGCEIRNKTYKDKYIIYKYDNTNNCVLLKPKTLTEAQPPALFPSTSTDANSGKSTLKYGTKSEVKPAQQKSNNCDRYETELFTKGGTRKRRKKRNHKVVTKRRQGHNRKSRRKGTRRI